MITTEKDFNIVMKWMKWGGLAICLIGGAITLYWYDWKMVVILLIIFTGNNLQQEGMLLTIINKIVNKLIERDKLRDEIRDELFGREPDNG